MSCAVWESAGQRLKGQLRAESDGEVMPIAYALLEAKDIRKKSISRNDPKGSTR